MKEKIYIRKKKKFSKFSSSTYTNGIQTRTFPDTNVIPR